MVAVVVCNGRERKALPRDHGYRAVKAGVYRSLPTSLAPHRASAIQRFVRAALLAQIGAWIVLAAVVVNVRFY